MLARKKQVAQFTQSPSKPVRRPDSEMEGPNTVALTGQEEETEEFDWESHSLLFAALTARLTSLQVARNYFTRGGMFL